MPRLIDISPRVSAGTAVWPGDVAFARTVTLDLEKGDPLTLSHVRSTLHLGAHADAPNHYLRGGAGIAGRPLELYYGPCEVVEVSVAAGARIRPEDLRRPVKAERVLFKTGSFPDPGRFSEDFASLAPDLVDALHAGGTRLVGIDTPSVDPFADKRLASHRRVAAHDMAILEGLLLDHVAPGAYRLIALPLALDGADASPVRAVLIAAP